MRKEDWPSVTVLKLFKKTQNIEAVWCILKVVYFSNTDMHILLLQ